MKSRAENTRPASAASLGRIREDRGPAAVAKVRHHPSTDLTADITLHIRQHTSRPEYPARADGGLRTMYAFLPGTRFYVDDAGCNDPKHDDRIPQSPETQPKETPKQRERYGHQNRHRVPFSSAS